MDAGLSISQLSQAHLSSQSLARNPRWDLTLDHHKELLSPYDPGKAARRLARYPSEFARFDPPFVVADHAAERWLDSFLRSNKRHIVVSSPKVISQMEISGFPHREELGKRMLLVESVHFGLVDGRMGRNYFEEMRRIEPDPEVIIGIGLGSVTDWAKLAGHKFSADVVIIPSALSTNAAFTGNAIIRDQSVGMNHNDMAQYSFTPHAPSLVVVDLGFIRHNRRGNISGVGDLLSSYVALRDWDLAIKHGQERDDSAIRRDTQELLKQLTEHGDGHAAQTPEWLMMLAQLNSTCSKLMTRFRSGRPKAGSEHVLAETIERATARRKILHGETIAVTNLVMTALYSARSDGSPTQQELRRLSERCGLSFDLNQIGFGKEELITALVQTGPKKNRFSFFDVFKIQRPEAEAVVKSIFADA